MTEHAVVVAGGALTDLMGGGQLARARLDVVTVEQRNSQDLQGSDGLVSDISRRTGTVTDKLGR